MKLKSVPLTVCAVLGSKRCTRGSPRLPLIKIIFVNTLPFCWWSLGSAPFEGSHAAARAWQLLEW